MRFLLDENVSYRVASHLKAAGQDAVHVSEVGLTSTDDFVILARARDEGWVLVSGWSSQTGFFLIWQSMTAQVNGFLPSQEPCLWCDEAAGHSGAAVKNWSRAPAQGC